jgi:hypothetical protein
MNPATAMRPDHALVSMSFIMAHRVRLTSLTAPLTTMTATDSIKSQIRVLYGSTTALPLTMAITDSGDIILMPHTTGQE